MAVPQWIDSKIRIGRNNRLLNLEKLFQTWQEGLTALGVKPTDAFTSATAYFGLAGPVGIGRRTWFDGRGVTSFSARAESACITSTVSERCKTISSAVP